MPRLSDLTATERCLVLALQLFPLQNTAELKQTSGVTSDNHFRASIRTLILANVVTRLENGFYAWSTAASPRPFAR